MPLLPAFEGMEMDAGTSISNYGPHDNESHGAKMKWQEGPWDVEVHTFAKNAAMPSVTVTATGDAMGKAGEASFDNATGKWKFDPEATEEFRMLVEQKVGPVLDQAQVQATQALDAEIDSVVLEQQAELAQVREHLGSADERPQVSELGEGAASTDIPDTGHSAGVDL